MKYRAKSAMGERLTARPTSIQLLKRRPARIITPQILESMLPEAAGRSGADGVEAAGVKPAGGPSEGGAPVPGRGGALGEPPPGVEPTPAFAPIAFKKAATPPPLGAAPGEEVAGKGRPPVAPVKLGGREAWAAFRWRSRTAEMNMSPNEIKVQVGNISNPWLPR